MPFPPERKNMIIKHEAARRRFLTICERCLPAWTKQLTSAELVELTTYLLKEMPPEICWLERADGLKLGGGYPADGFASEPIAPDEPAEGAQETGPPAEEWRITTAPGKDIKPLTGFFKLVAIERHSGTAQVAAEAETVPAAALWLPGLVDRRSVNGSCCFCAGAVDADWIISLLKRRRP